MIGRVAYEEGVLQALQRVTDAALAHLSEEDLLTELLRRITEILDADTAAFLLLDEEQTSSSHARPRASRKRSSRASGSRSAAASPGEWPPSSAPVVIPDVGHADIYNPILREKGIRSLLGVPLLIEGRVTGVLHVGTLTPRVFTEGDRDLLQLAADRAALAIEHAHLLDERTGARARRAGLPPPGVAPADHRRRARVPAGGGAPDRAPAPDQRDPRQ